MTIYSLDSTALINSWNRHYSIDLAPGYWSAVSDLTAAGTVVISEEVRDEVYEQRDELAAWARKNLSPWHPLSSDVQRCLGLVMKDWSHMVRNGKRNRADPVVVATALAIGAVVVTEEGPGKATAPGIPRVCDGMNVKHMTTWEFVRAARINLAG